jgi:hypothetical protein
MSLTAKPVRVGYDPESGRSAREKINVAENISRYYACIRRGRHAPNASMKAAKIRSAYLSNIKLKHYWFSKV